MQNTSGLNLQQLNLTMTLKTLKHNAQYLYIYIGSFIHMMKVVKLIVLTTTLC